MIEINFSEFIYNDKDGFIYYKGKKLYEEIINGYVVVTCNGQRKRKHRLVWEIVNKKEIPKGLVINHIDGNKLNNNPNNLEVVTNKENTQKWAETQDKDELLKNFEGKKVYAYNIFTFKETKYNKIMDASRDLEISDKAIAFVLSKKQKTTHNYIFSYNKINNIVDYIKENVDFEKLKNKNDLKIKVTDSEDNIKIYENKKDVCNKLNIKIENLNRYLRKERKNPKGLTFEYC